MYLRAFIDACEGFGWSGGPEFSTRIKTLQNGRERRNANWAQPRHRYTLPFLNIGQDQYRAIRQMFEVCQGMANAFLYRDQLGYSAQNQLFAVADGRTEYQLTTLSIIDGVSYQREVTALYVPDASGDCVQATPVVTVNGTPTAVTVDYDRGTVLFSPAPTIGAILRWSGEFAVWVRFDQDWLPMSIDNRRGGDYAINGNVQLLELPPPEEVET